MYNVQYQSAVKVTFYKSMIDVLLFYTNMPVRDYSLLIPESIVTMMKMKKLGARRQEEN